MLGGLYLLTISPDVPKTKTKKTIITNKILNGTISLHFPDNRYLPVAGIVVDHRGYAITAYHGIFGFSKLEARLYNETRKTVNVVSSNRKLDLVLLKIIGRIGKKEAKEDIVPLKLAPELPNVGDPVIVCGSPLGYEHSLSHGIVSGLGRKISWSGRPSLTGVIQTDTPINPGNSGGPLCDINGNVIGMIVAVRDGAQGISFAIPARTLQEFLEKNLR